MNLIEGVSVVQHNFFSSLLCINCSTQSRIDIDQFGLSVEEIASSAVHETDNNRLINVQYIG
ncbi:hypothetical protein D3C80_2057790 [compost metagenome]